MSRSVLRLHGTFERYELVPWWDARGAQARAAPRWTELRAWCADDLTRAQLAELYDHARGTLAPHGTTPPAHELLAALEEAFATGLLALRVERVESGDAQPPATPRAATEPPRQPPPATREEVTHWVELELRDEAQQPVGNARYVLVGAGGATREGRLDAQGFARVEGLDPDAWRVTFPDYDGAEWARA